MDYECNCVGCHLGNWVSTQWWRLRLRLGLVKPFVDSDPVTIWAKQALPTEWLPVLPDDYRQVAMSGTIIIPSIGPLKSAARAQEVNDDGMA